MAYKYSKGATVQGDIKAADDAQRDTLIDFGEDRIDLQTSGTVRFTVENDTITTTVPIHVSGSSVEGIRVAKGGSDYRAIVFEVDGQDNANISVSNAENFVIQNEMNGKDIQFWVNPSAGSSIQAMTIKEDGKIGISQTSPSQILDVGGDVNVSGTVYYQDFLMTELSIPGLDLQTDTNAYTFNCPYDLEVEGLQLFLDQHTTSGNVTVTVNGAGTDMISLSLTGTATATETSTVTSGSLNAADRIRFAITATPANAQGLRANLQFRRTPE